MTLDAHNLAQHHALLGLLEREIKAASEFLASAQYLAGLLNSAIDLQALETLNREAVEKAQLVQNLHLQRENLVREHKLNEIDQAGPCDPERAALDMQRRELEYQLRELVEESRLTNHQNGIVIGALLEQTQAHMQALQRAARQGDTYGPSGRSQSESRPLACA